MKVPYKLELIGDNIVQECRGFTGLLNGLADGLGDEVIGDVPFKQPWIARITGTDTHYGLQRVFLSGNKDYSQANSVGSRGVYCVYFLDSDSLYEVFERTSWRASRRFFLSTLNGRLTEIDKGDAHEWAKSMDSESTSSLLQNRD